jgi:hypothetical protein
MADSLQDTYALPGIDDEACSVCNFASSNC